MSMSSFWIVTKHVELTYRSSKVFIIMLHAFSFPYPTNLLILFDRKLVSMYSSFHTLSSSLYIFFHKSYFDPDSHTALERYNM
mmetsp:Transcript_23873/g.43165  ORF Transcript_23873/g.43165 Transcript_23873/m.43165 type:complete len:83 (-) Transcript_23873:258-506(-)